MTKQNAAKSVAYCRVSLSDQDPKNQTTNIEEFAKARGLNLTKVYTDHGLSGALAVEKRPQLEQLVRDARMGKFKVVIVSGLDRIARDVRHLMNLLHELDGYGVSLISIREQIDFTTSLGKATMAIIGAVAGLERDLLRDRVKSAMYAKKVAAEKAGEKWKCGRPSKINTDNLVEIFRLHDEGLSARLIGQRVGLSKSSILLALKGRAKRV
jgi:DNA invertase Pin-like site-specific DNA recombinase